MDVTGNRPVWFEEIFPILGKILINTMFDQTQTSSRMRSSVVITLGVIGFFMAWNICIIGKETPTQEYTHCKRSPPPVTEEYPIHKKINNT